MSKFWIEDELIERYLSKISGNEWKVLIAITRHYNKQGTCYPSIRRLTGLVNLSTVTISKCLNLLEFHGFLEKLEIRERCKLRYKFTKTAEKLLIETNKLPRNVSGKEVKKEDIKEAENLKPLTAEQVEANRESLRKRRKELIAKKVIRDNGQSEQLI